MRKVDPLSMSIQKGGCRLLSPKPNSFGRSHKISCCPTPLSGPGSGIHSTTDVSTLTGDSPHGVRAHSNMGPRHNEYDTRLSPHPSDDNPHQDCGGGSPNWRVRVSSRDRSPSMEEDGGIVVPGPVTKEKKKSQG